MPDAEEDKPEPDLDELLELFREPEEERRPRASISGVVWLALALILSLIGVWLAARVSSMPASKDTKAGPMKPGKVSDRPAREDDAGTVDVMEAYIARCRKGMTAREVRWIVEDFQKAGLDRSAMNKLWDIVGSSRDDAGMDAAVSEAANKEALRISKQQSHWYLGLLADALNLDKQQRVQSTERYRTWFGPAEANFLERQKEVVEGRQAPGYYPIAELPPYAGLLEASEWLEDEALAPWALCDLADDQLAITHHEEVIQERSGPESSQEEDSYAYRSWLDRRPLVGIGAVKRKSIDDILWRPSYEEAGWIFPFHSEQQFSGTEGDLLEIVKRLHPAQLKTLLLLDPQAADDLSKLLDSTNE
ncbi:hypothetical protein OKA05_05045 [Luteolibacter arcticus]|uniref:Uncharacterized protein n=1 Tax=Luteolibacter arcticus TaxID=1581411 RepID=A0ABT3GE70_9BACT|nr:hypothetical protein [Luteolibacter arcticus]MCW1921907.1 hypothetical protein [Luteolibacter arcticus]